MLGFSGLGGGQTFTNAHHPAAVLLRDGEVFGAVGEERFSRVKDAHGQFPHRAIAWLLRTAGIELSDLSAVAWSNDPVGGQRRWARRERHRLARQALATVISQAEASHRPLMRELLSLIDSGFRPADLVRSQRAGLVKHFGPGPDIDILCVDHHLCHAASAYYPSGMDQATVITWDGSGDGLTGSVGHGHDGGLALISEYSDFSIGGLYWCLHSYLNLSDEGSLMGLAAYGDANGALDPYVRSGELFVDHATLAGYHDPDAAYLPYSPRAMRSLAPPRRADDELLAAHRNLAAELQVKVEELCFEVVKRAVDRTRCRRLAIAGGVGLNAVVNGKLGRCTELCEELFIQPNAGDEGGALGAAMIASRDLGDDVAHPMNHSYFGPEESSEDTQRTLSMVGVPYQRMDDEALLPMIARELAGGRLIGWVQGRLEWGPRALGNRSNLGRSTRPEAAARVNEAVKYRDPWRPFAPSMLVEAAEAYLVDPFFSPFMLTTFAVRQDMRSVIPSVVHADGTTRPQMVTETANPRYYRLIAEFAQISGVPVLLNTSFNLKGEPIVATTLDALRTFFSSGLDVLVVGNYVVDKHQMP